MIEEKIIKLLESLKGIKGTFIVEINYNEIKVKEILNGNTCIDYR